jgi:hypothetical protein
VRPNIDRQNSTSRPWPVYLDKEYLPQFRLRLRRHHRCWKLSLQQLQFGNRVGESTVAFETSDWQMHPGVEGGQMQFCSQDFTLVIQVADGTGHETLVSLGEPVSIFV